MLPFTKMHGLGNDFVIIDARQKPFMPTITQLRHLADRRFGIGCDQIIVIAPARTGDSDAFMHIYNPDGSAVGACGNATRCIAHLLCAEQNADHITIETTAGLLECQRSGDQYQIDMGPARLDWRDIPLRDAMDTGHILIPEFPELGTGVAVNMGNPHIVFFTANVDTIDIARIGPVIERYKFFPERTNVEFAQVIDRRTIRMRVWERGAGITLACGSGACATLVAAVRRNLTERQARLILDGGELAIDYLRDGHVLMTGPASLVYTGQIHL
jgi:diaminopimelate epimerase